MVPSGCCRFVRRGYLDHDLSLAFPSRQRGNRHRRSPSQHVDPRLGRPPARRRRSPILLSGEHLLSARTEPGFLRASVPAVTRRASGASSVRESDPRLQRRASRRFRHVGPGNVPARFPADEKHQRRHPGWLHLRFLSFHVCSSFPGASPIRSWDSPHFSILAPILRDAKIQGCRFVFPVRCPSVPRERLLRPLPEFLRCFVPCHTNGRRRTASDCPGGGKALRSGVSGGARDQSFLLAVPRLQAGNGIRTAIARGGQARELPCDHPRPPPLWIADRSPSKESGQPSFQASSLSHSPSSASVRSSGWGSAHEVFPGEAALPVFHGMSVLSAPSWSRRSR